ncbi:MAG: hypothetical protein ACRDUT_16375 [Mycobacterium sp.]
MRTRGFHVEFDLPMATSAVTAPAGGEEIDYALLAADNGKIGGERR